jgi:LPXTG-motif cell wall-anchored protein
MDKKKLLIIGGVLLVAGAGIYFWKKSKDGTSSDSDDNSTGSKSDGSTKSTTATAPTTASAPVTETTAPATETTAPAKTLNTRKEKRKACGRRPALKKKRTEWQQCVDAGGEASFEGDFDGFQRDYMDFQGVGSYSSFQSQFDIDL